MTPFPTPNTPSLMRYNNAHRRIRCAIERLNGALKRPFACLNYQWVEPQQACSIILACIVLHNIATQRRVPLWHRWSSTAPCSCWWSRPTCGFSSKWETEWSCELLLFFWRVITDNGLVPFLLKIFLFVQRMWMWIWLNSLFGQIQCSERYARGHCVMKINKRKIYQPRRLQIMYHFILQTLPSYLYWNIFFN